MKKLYVAFLMALAITGVSNFVACKKKEAHKDIKITSVKVSNTDISLKPQSATPTDTAVIQQYVLGILMEYTTVKTTLASRPFQFVSSAYAANKNVYTYLNRPKQVKIFTVDEWGNGYPAGSDITSIFHVRDTYTNSFIPVQKFIDTFLV